MQWWGCIFVLLFCSGIASLFWGLLCLVNGIFDAILFLERAVHVKYPLFSRQAFQETLAECIGVLKNDLGWHMREPWGTPKPSILMGLSIINHPFWGTSIYGNPYLGWHIYECIFLKVFFRCAMVPSSIHVPILRVINPSIGGLYTVPKSCEDVHGIGWVTINHIIAYIPLTINHDFPTIKSQYCWMYHV